MSGFYKNPYVRWAAVRTLGRMTAPNTAKIVPTLVSLMDDENQEVRITVFAALERFGGTAKSAGPDLANALRSKWDGETRVWAIRALRASEGRGA